MKFKIEKAYDSVHLSEASKERILEELMDSQKPGFRTHQKAAPGPKWRAIPVALILIIVIAVGGFLGIKALGGRDMQSVATEPSDPTDHLYLKDDVIVTDTKEPFDYERFYADVPEYLRDHVIMYAQAFYEDWPQEDWKRFGLNLDLYQVRDLVECGFVMKDLDSDGFEDLLIYGGKQLYQILVVNFWPVDTAMGQPAHTLWCLTREENESRMFLCEDNVIMHTYVLNDGDKYIDYCRLGKNSSGLSCLETIETVFAIDGTEWFAGPNYKDAVPISAEEADNIRDGYELEEVEPRLFPRKKVHAVDYEQEYADVPEYLRDHVIMYAQAFYEDWPREDWERFGLNLDLYQARDLVECGFVMKDLDGDGLEDLLIYGDSRLYEVLIVNSWPHEGDLDKPDYCLWSFPRDENGAWMSLCEDNVIMIRERLNERDIRISFNRFGKNEDGLPYLDTIETIYSIDGSEWFAGTSEQDEKAITAEEVERIKSSYNLEVVEPRPFPGIRVYVVNFQHQFDGVDARYLPLLMNYGKAMCEGWSQSRWVEAGLSLEVFYVQDEYWSLEYALVDMDGNGSEELLIFGDDQLYALYVLRNDQPDERLEWKIHHNAERLSIQLCENNVVKVCQEDASGAIDTSFYQVGRDGVGDLSLVMVNNVLYTPDGQWYAGPNAKDAVAVTESEAQALVASYVPVEIEGIPMLNKVRIE